MCGKSCGDWPRLIIAGDPGPGEIVAFTDDDVIADRYWLTEIARAFEIDVNVACVTGLIMAAELQTHAQVLLESHGGLGKGFEQRVVDLGNHRPANPLFPFTAGQLGSGANMSFRRDRLRELGGSDPAVGRARWRAEEMTWRLFSR